MGDNIAISGGQQGAVGSQAIAVGNQFQQGLSAADLALLAEQLAALRQAMKSAAATAWLKHALGL